MHPPACHKVWRIALCLHQAGGRSRAHLCQRGLSKSVKSRTCRSSDASPAGPMPPCNAAWSSQTSFCDSERGVDTMDDPPNVTSDNPGCLAEAFLFTMNLGILPSVVGASWACIPTETLRACTTTMLPTAAAACAARGEGGSPCGAIFSHLPLLTSMMCTSLVAPASLMPAARTGNDGPHLASACAAICMPSRKRPKPCAWTQGASPVPVGGPGDAGGPSER